MTDSVSARNEVALNSLGIASRRAQKTIGWVAKGNEAVVVVAIFIDLALTFYNTVDRYITGSGLIWLLDASTIALNIIAFLGGAAYYRSGAGLAFTSLVDRVRPAPRDVLRAASTGLVMSVAIGTLVGFPTLLDNSRVERLQVLQVTELTTTIWIGIGYVLIFVFGLEKLLQIPWRRATLGLAFAAVGFLLLSAWRWQFSSALADVSPLVPITVVALAALISGTSIAFVLAIGGMAYFFVVGTIPMVVIPATFQAGIGNFILLAVPFFLLAGVLLEVTGMAGRLVDLMALWVAQWPGGLLLTEVAAMYVFSGMSGSKTADMACVGSVMRTSMLKRGYPPRESVAVLAASAAMGETIPPSVSMLILGSITSLSIASLFLSGLLPAAVLAAAIGLGIMFRARGGRLPHGEPFRVGPALRAVPAAIPALLLPVIVVGGIVFGIGTPTEVSSFAVVYGLVVAALVYRSVTLRGLWTLLKDAALITGIVLLIISSANLFAHAITLAGLAQQLSTLVLSAGGYYGFLIVSTLMLMAVGVVLEGLPAMLIFAPLFLPIAISVGVNPLQFGIILIMSQAIASFAPPIGVGLYQACVIGGSTMDDVMGASIFYTAVLIVGLAVVVAVPEITTFIPHLFHVPGA
jgi:C4-dicarboxylate transporter, DctM subunit